VLQIMDPENIIDNERNDNSTDSGIRKVDSYPDFRTNENYLVQH
jgi:hypothetical protein